MLKLLVEINGKNSSDLIQALEQVINKIDYGYSSGFDSNDDGDYDFRVEGEEEVEITIEETVHDMIESLKYQADKYDIEKDEIAKLFEKYNVNGLDDLFQDGGEVRCENFTDLAFDYALQFGEFESREFEDARWEVIKKAMDEF